jgi:hypothetical protein
MLRLRYADGAHARWRASLDEVATGERHTFPSLDELVAFLRGQLQSPPEATEGDAGSPEPGRCAGAQAERRGQ